MATNGTNKKKKKKSGKPDFFFIGLLGIIAFVGIYLLFTWDWPSNKQEDLIGKWYYDTSDVSVETESGYNSVASVYYDFSEDWKWTLTNSSSGATSTGTYAIDGKTLTFNFDSGADPESFAFVIKGSKLTLGEKSDTVVLTRVK